MTFPITPNWGIHSDPSAGKVARLQLEFLFATLERIFAELPGEIINGLVNAILNALGLGGLIGPLDALEAAVGNGLQTAVMNPLGLLVGGLENALPTVVDFLDGTAIALSGILTKPDGTATNLVANGVADVTTLVNNFGGVIPAVVDNLDGTAQKVAGVVFNNDGTALLGALLGVNPMVLATEAHNSVHSLLNSVGVSNVGQLTTALAGVLPAALDNADGTAAHIGTQIVQNLDGTATYIGDILGGASTSLNSLIDNLDGTAMSFAKSIASGFSNTLGGLLNAFTGTPVSGITATQAQQAQVTAAAAALQSRLVTIGNGGEEQVDVEFSTYTDGSLPAVFTTFAGGLGSAMVIKGGTLCITGTGITDQNVYYNAATTLTDYQQISMKIASADDGGLGGSGFQVFLIGRLNPSTTKYVQAQYIGNSGVWNIASSTGGSSFAFTFIDPSFAVGNTYTLVCGDPSVSNAYKYQLLRNGTPLAIGSVSSGDVSANPAGQLYYLDNSHLSLVGGSNRNCGLGFIASGSGFTFNIGVSNFLFQDTTQSAPSVLVATSESTTSTTYTDLTTTSDEVAVKIGTSGMAQVFLNCTFNNQSWCSFAMSGANTLAANDNVAICDTYAAAATVARGAPFLLTGLSPGLTIFKMKYRSNNGAGQTFSNRRIGVVAL